MNAMSLFVMLVASWSLKAVESSEYLELSRTAFLIRFGFGSSVRWPWLRSSAKW